MVSTPSNSCSVVKFIYWLITPNFMISTGGIFNKKEVSRNTNGKLKKKFTKYFYIYIHIFA